MRAVLISIQPKWCALIASGKKTIEVRKTKPKIAKPFKVYIYCTLPPKEEIFGHGGVYEYANELIRLQSGEIVYDYGMRLCCDPEGRPYTRDNFLCKKVIGEFICDRISTIAYTVDGLADVVDCDTSCLSPKEFVEYGKGKPLYGWHISDLVIYEKPKPLSMFYKECGGLDNTGLCDECENAVGEECDCAVNGQLHLTRPPQSWCYVEEVKK